MCSSAFDQIDQRQMPFFILRKAIEIYSGEFYCCFIDLKAAYDWIDRDMLFKVLEIRLRSPIIVKILKALYTGTTATIKHTHILFFKHLLDVVRAGWNLQSYLTST